jgi:anti-sigma factor RsiW
VTSTTDAAGHPDVAEISDLTEGMLPADRGADIQRHLETCGLCADVRASLEEIRGLLGSAPDAEPMPADVAARIDAALAAEPLPSGSRVTAEDRVSRETSTPADRPVGRPHATTGPGRKKSGHGRRRRAVVLGTVLTAAVLGAGSLVFQSFSGGTSTTTAHSTPSPSLGTFSGTSVESQVRDLLPTKKAPKRGYDSQHPRSGLTGGENTPQGTESANTLLQTEIPVPDCVRRAIPSGDEALAAKAGTYAGKSAYLVVLPDRNDGTRVTVYVVDAACMGRQTGAAGTVLLKRSFARP